MEYVAQNLNLPVDAKHFAERSDTNESGTRPWKMAQVFLELGYFCEFRTGLDYFDLKTLSDEFFIIVDWWAIFDEDGKAAAGDGHYSVVLDVTGKTITLFDPDIMGARTLPRAVFEAHWYDVGIDENGARSDVLCGALLIKKPSGYS